MTDNFGQVVQYLDSWAWGVSIDGSTVCLGQEDRVKAVIASPNKLVSGYPDIDQIIELEKELQAKEKGINGQQPELQRPGTFRSRTAGKAKRGATHVKPASFRKRLSGHSSKR